MEFCDFCENLMYVKLDDEGNDNAPRHLVKYCKNCEFSKVYDDVSSELLNENNYDTDKEPDIYISPYLKHDRTMPRVNNLVCRNKDCTKPEEADNIIIYIKYDKKKLKYVYICEYCNSYWKS
jgi:DNA-directed RNA polymerase subunit M/transcription elongation factor TFIIS